MLFLLSSHGRRWPARLFRRNSCASETGSTRRGQKIFVPKVTGRRSSTTASCPQQGATPTSMWISEGQPYGTMRATASKQPLILGRQSRSIGGAR